MADAEWGLLGDANGADLARAHAEEVAAYEAFLGRIYGRVRRKTPAGLLRGRRREEAKRAEGSTNGELASGALGSSCASPPREPELQAAEGGQQGPGEGEAAGGGVEAALAWAAAEAFRVEVELEEEILARARREPWERGGFLGVSVMVRCSGLAVASETGHAFFADAISTAVLALLKQAAEESPSSAIGEGVDGALHAIGSFVGHVLMHGMFPEGARRHFQDLIDVLIRPADSLQAILTEWLRLDRAARPARLADVKARVTSRLQELLLHVKRLVESVLAPEEEVEALYRALAVLSPLVGLPYGWVLPDVAKEDALPLVLRGPRGTTDVTVHRDLLATDLKELLAQRLGFPASLRLLREEDGVDVPLADDEPVADCRGTISCSEQPHPSAFPDVRTWLVQDPFSKVTAKTATKLLADLRATYSEPDFFRDYHQMRLEGQGLHIDKAVSVQSLFLPSYGFEGSRRGVMEMRKQVSFLAEKDPALGKALHDIHGLLDAHRPLPSMPVTKPLEAARFAPQDVEGWSAHLADEGYVVIAGVADERQVGEAYDLLWNFLERADGSRRVSRSDVRSWHDSDRPGMGWPAGDDGIIGGRGIGQSQVMWYLRSLPRLRRVFQDLWHAEHLVASFDGAGVYRPYSHDSRWRTRKKNWFHLDQAHYKRGLHCVQGLVNLKDATEETGGLVVVPRSHRFHNDVMRRYNGGDAMEDFVRIDITDPVLVEGVLGPRMVAARSGDLVLWDSRTVHCNTAPLRESRHLLASDDLIRAVAYICMTPASWCSLDALRQRRHGVEAGVTTKHWPHEYHPKSVPREWRPEFSLGEEHWSLVCPGGDEQPQRLPDGSLRPGSISCLPSRGFKVVAESTPLRSAATTKWAAPICSLRAGEPVEGHAMGDWLRLTAWPQEPGRPSPMPERGSEEDVWALLSDLEPC